MNGKDYVVTVTVRFEVLVENVPDEDMAIEIAQDYFYDKDPQGGNPLHDNLFHAAGLTSVWHKAETSSEDWTADEVVAA